MIGGINHLTFAIKDLERSIRFYREVLGCELLAEWPKGAYLTAGPVWIALVLDSDTRTHPLPEYTHVAFTVSRESLAALKQRVEELQIEVWQENFSEGDSLYLLDPDGHKLELHVTGLAERMKWLREHPLPGLRLRS